MRARPAHQIASDLRDRIEYGRPYGLAFYNTEHDITEPISTVQRIELEKHLAYVFHQIWARTWILPLADEIEGRVPNVGYRRFVNTLADLQECHKHLADQGGSQDEQRAREGLRKLCLDIAKESFDLRDEMEGQ